MLITDATNLPRLMQCIGSRLMPASEAPKESSRESANEGNAAHWLIQQATANPNAIVTLQDQLSPFGVTVDATMCEHVAEYLSAIARPGARHTEYDTTLNGGNWRVDARADHIVWNAETATLYVDDFKYGWRIVEPDGNWTLIAHALGYILAHQIKPAAIVLSIFQPRPHHAAGPMRSHTYTVAELFAFHERIDRTLTEQSATTRTGPACHYCPAIANCPAAYKAGQNAVDVSDIAVNDELSNDRLSYELDQLKRAGDMIKDRRDALENLAKFRITSGQIVNNYMLETGLSNRRWAPGWTPEMVNALCGKIVASPKFITPAQAEKIGVPDAVLKALTERVPTGIKLKRVSADATAKRLFGKV